MQFDDLTPAERGLLFQPGLDDPPVAGWTRRGFLSAVGAGALLGTGLQLQSLPLEAWAADPAGPSDGLLVVLTLFGGNDGLNTVVPFTDSAYYAHRPALAIAPDAVLAISDTFGLHPNLPFLKSMFDAGHVAIVHGVGYPQPDLSHFRSTAIWMHGHVDVAGFQTGWLGRWLDMQPGTISDFAGVSIGSTVPLHMLGASRRAVAVSHKGTMFGSGTSAAHQRIHAAVRDMVAAQPPADPLRHGYASALAQQLDLASATRPVFATGLPSQDLPRKLTIAARLLNANIGVRVLDVSRGGFDNHAAQTSAHPALLAELDQGLQAFYGALDATLRNRVAILVVSEFGRAPKANASSGTDHGTANVCFVIGTQVSGGLLGTPPDLTSFDANGRLIANLDFRTLYGTVIDGWMGGGGVEVIGAPLDPLQVFATQPGAGPAVPPVPDVHGGTVAIPSGFEAMTPRRILDTRDGTGGVSGQVGPASSIEIDLSDTTVVPDGAVAIALNVTAVNATLPTFVTVWPSGLDRPLASNLNPDVGDAVPNLVVVPLGAGRRVAVYNNGGSVDLVADLVGHFTPDSFNSYAPMTPTRLIDTRDGAPIGQGGTIAVEVGGRAGTPKDAAAAVLNVTVTEPTATTYLTVYPSGEERPLASSLNATVGRTVPNLVIARLGANGAVDVYNNGGDAHLVVDLFGYFSDSAATRFTALAPRRILDTRDGTGAPPEAIGQSPLVLAVRGKAGVPGSATGALLNVTAVDPTADTYLTVYPTAVDRPLASNLNPIAGQTVPNMVAATLAEDGTISVYNNAGTVHVVADVLGWFGP